MAIDTGGWDEQPGQNVPTTTSAGTVNPGGNYWSNPSNWLNWINIGLEGLNAYGGYRATQDANSKNVRMAREAREWDKMMSDTAVQRRALDIEKAGGNRALAFTSGQSASSPVVSPATVSPSWEPGWTKGMGAASMMLRAQLDNIQAQTIKTSADTQRQRTETRILEKFGEGTAEAKLKRAAMEAELADMKRDVMSNMVFQSAAERRRVEETVDAMIQRAKQDAEEGQLNIEALRNLASVGGIEAGKAKGVIQMIINLLRGK